MIKGLELLLPESHSALQLALATGWSAQNGITPIARWNEAYWEHLMTVWA